MLEIKHSEKGVTIVELLIVLSLFSLVLGGIYQLYFLTERNFTQSETQSQVIQEANSFQAIISNEIRSAVKPDETRHAVVVSNSNDEIDIYRFFATDNEFERISYRIDESQNILEKGWIRNTNPANLDTINNWRTVLNNVSSLTIEDETPNAESERRITKINLNIEHPSNYNMTIENTYMNRSGKINYAGFEGHPDTPVPVTGIETDKMLYTVARPASTIQITANIIPTNAWNKTVQYSSNSNWITFPSGVTSESGVNNQVNIAQNGGPAGQSRNYRREGVITIRSDEGDFSVNIIIKQNGARSSW